MTRVALLGWTCAALIGASAPALAQTAPAGTGPMVVERLHSGLTVAPVVKAGDIDGNTHVLAGAEAGWVVDQKVFIGGAGFGMTDGQRDERLGYGGVVVEWRLLPASSPIRFGVKGLVGGGSATLETSLSQLASQLQRNVDAVRVNVDGRPVGNVTDLRGAVGGLQGGVPGRGGAVPPGGRIALPRILVRDDFIVFEPEVTVDIRLGRLVNVSAGASYRATANTGLLNDRLNGAAASLAVHFGGW